VRVVLPASGWEMIPNVLLFSNAAFKSISVFYAKIDVPFG